MKQSLFTDAFDGNEAKSVGPHRSICKRGFDSAVNSADAVQQDEFILALHALAFAPLGGLHSYFRNRHSWWLTEESLSAKLIDFTDQPVVLIEELLNLRAIGFHGVPQLLNVYKAIREGTLFSFGSPQSGVAFAAFTPALGSWPWSTSVGQQPDIVGYQIRRRHA